MVPLASVPSLVVEKSFDYRGAPEVWSNRYHFVNGVPPDLTHWTALADAVVAAEKTFYTSRVTIVRARGYLHDEKPEVAVLDKTYSVAGTLSTSLPFAPGDCAALVSWKTLERDSKGHPIYCHAYYHDCRMSATAGSDYIGGAQLGPMQTYATTWCTPGFSDGATLMQRSSPDGHLCVSGDAKGPIHRRKLKRRGG